MSLKDIRGRINSVTVTLKITDVTRMISSAKLHKAQNTLRTFSKFKNETEELFFALVSGASIPLSEKRQTTKNVVIAAISSNSSLCGAFNLNLIRQTGDTVNKYKKSGADVTLYAFGKKVYDAFIGDKSINVKGPYYDLIMRPDYNSFTPVAEEIIGLYAKKEADAVEAVYNHFKNILTQYPVSEKILPITIPEEKQDSKFENYILEPDKEELISFLTPQTIKLMLYEKLLESAAAEHGARTSAMQAASDNAMELIDELSLKYNKLRQASITKEILDIVGGAEALR